MRLVILALALQVAVSFAPFGGRRGRLQVSHSVAEPAAERATTALPEGLTREAVHKFGAGEGTLAAPDEPNLKWLLGGKGANLAEMAAIGLDVPPGLTMTTEMCALYQKMGNTIPPQVWDQVLDGIAHVEQAMGAKLGDSESPLLLSVRSGAAISMPGMMDTVLNLGMTDDVAAALAKKTGNARFAYDSYRRFLDMFGDVVMGVPHHAFEEVMDNLKMEKGVLDDNELTAEDLQELVPKYKAVYAEHGVTCPDTPLEQLRLAIAAVFDSWQSERAIKYMEVQQITGLLGTAVNVQAMVFGNMGATSGTGVCFTRDPSTGDEALFGEYLIDAQGEDVVAGIRTPLPIAKLDEDMPAVYEQLLANTDTLEKHFKDMQDIEFTVQEGRLYLLQTRSGKRGGQAAVRIATELVSEGLLDRDAALDLVTPEHLDMLLHPQFEDAEAPAYKAAVVATGLPASPGAAVGVAVFSSADAEMRKAAGESVILVRDETSPEDVGGMFAAEGIVTARGGMTSHAAVVARGWGKTCVCGVPGFTVDEAAGVATLAGGAQIKAGDIVSLNGNTGEVVLGAMPLAAPQVEGALAEFMEWVDERRTVAVLANADTPADAAEARRNGAEGIGLCRTEHMFFDHLPAVRRMILAPDDSARQAAIAELLPLQRADFEGIFKVMDGLPVTVRLLDPPLHEFLPHEADEALAASVGRPLAVVAAELEALRESNPMLGLRGCRLGITKPEIISMQARAFVEAAYDAAAAGVVVKPKLMVPLIGTLAEFKHQTDIIRAAAAAVASERAGEADIGLSIGTMIEVPRAAMLASQLAPSCDFFSFGTNDLTQMTFGYSRDDVGSFLPTYLAEGILPHDPFQVFDAEGVGQLVERATTEGRAANPALKCGVCGEHGGDPTSIEYFASIKQDYVSCSPFRVPLARLAAAQAAISAQK